MVRASLLWIAVAVTSAAGPVHAGAELVLVDGQVLAGVDVELVEGEYRLELESGTIVSIPAELVAELRLIADEEPWPPTGLSPADPEMLAGREAFGPTGLHDRGPEVLAGSETYPPTTTEQLAALGDPSRFREPVIDPEWRPRSDWDLDLAQNEFHPARWAEPPIDPEWAPESAFGREDVLEAGRATWREDVVNPYWAPEDGFRKRQAALGS